MHCAFDGSRRRPDNVPVAPHCARAVYDRIGPGYAARRRTDPRIAAAVDAALGDARTLVNVGAGAGAYESPDRHIIAVEPSPMMIRQRPAGAAPCIRAIAEELPFPDRSFDASLAVLTLHHWTDQGAGLAELRRVAGRRVVILTWDPAGDGDFWLTREYFPEILAHDLPRFPSMDSVAQHLGPIQLIPVLVPHDCHDGFLGAFWRRPEAYLDPLVRGAISAFALLDPETVERGVTRLTDDLASGRWETRHGSLRQRESLDVGYRLIVAERG
jgi:SAM-dependent methyltransferase